MSIFVTATPAPTPKSKDIRAFAILAAVVLVIMAVAQLFSYEDFPSVMASYWLTGDQTSAPIFAALLVSLEVLAVPFLLSMRLSPAMRALSMLAGWLVIVIWLLLLIPANLGVSVVTNAGMLGATLAEPISWWLVVRIAALGVLIAWAAWGMWPFPVSEKSSTK